MHQSSFEKMLSFRDAYLEGRQNEPLRILDLGSMDVNGSYKPIFDSTGWIYQGVDLSTGPNVDLVLQNPYSWKEIPSGSADVFVSGQAFEHIEFFWITILEVMRVLRTGGLCCIIAPAGGFEHRYPVDCWRFYPDGMRALARFARLTVLEVSTQWDPNPEYARDDSNRWHDSILICTKFHLPLIPSFRRWFRNRLLHRLLALRV